MLPVDIQYIKEGLDQKIKGKYELIIPTDFSEEVICREAAGADVLLGPYVTGKIIDAAGKLSLIQVPWTGMDTFDFSAVQGKSIPVCNTHSNADSVAEIAVAITLDLLKKTAYHDRKMRIGNWNRDQKPLNLKSRMVNRQTICMLGYGNIGSRIGKLFGAFGARVTAVDDNAVSDDCLVETFTNEKLLDGIAGADVVICTLPLTQTTRGMLSTAFFNGMKDGAVFINMSRAAIVDEDAVWEALENGHLSGFGADVWWNAPKRGESQSYPSARHPFWERDNVLMSPHRAGFVEGSLPHLDGAIENIIALTEGGKLVGQVNVGVGY